MSGLSRFVPGWVARYSLMLANGACLLAAWWLARFVTEAAMPFSGLVLVLIVLVSVRTLAPDASAGFWRYAALYLRGQLAAGAACVAAGRLIWDWPWATFAFLPLWIGFTTLTLPLLLAFHRAPSLGVFLRTVVTGSNDWLGDFARRRAASGDDTALSGAVLVGAIAFFFGRLNPSLDLEWPVVLLPSLLWLAVDRVPLARWQTAPDRHSRFARFFGRLALWSVFLGAVALVSGEGSPREVLAALACMAGGLAAFGLSHWHRVVAGSTNAARTFLGLFAAGLIHPFASHRLLGAQDALWYLNTLTDFFAQLRAGVFPVFVGQSEHLFNGGVLPIRFAPLFQHYGFLFNTLTWGTLTPAAVQNGVLIATFFAAAASAYAVFEWVLRGRAWLAAGLSALFVSCPGVLAVVYYEDLFMTWTTLPWLPLVFGGCLLGDRSRNPWPLLLTSTALGIIWWGHAPVALWTTAAVAVIQLARLVTASPRQWPWRSLFGAAAAFGAIAFYPLVSVLAVPVQTGAESLQYTATDPGAIVHFIRECFPEILIPPPFKTRSLSDFQPGWPLLILLGICVGAMCRRQHRRQLDLWILLAVPLGLQLMLVPIPRLTPAVWSWVPGFLVNPTGTWAMQRFYVIIAISGVCAAAALLRQAGTASRRWNVGLHWLLGAALIGSILGVIPFLRVKDARRQETAQAADPTLPESHVLTRYAYLVFGKPPAYYSHGHVDPYHEQRLLDPENQRLIGGNPQAIMTEPTVGRVLHEGEIRAEVVNPGDPWQLRPTFRLEPGKHYVLDLRFNHAAEPGVLLVNGPGLKRVYALPDYGEKKAFGSGPDASSLLSLFTSGREPVDVTLQFAEKEPARAVDFSRFGTYRWLEVDRDSLPIRVTGWIPYQAKVDSPAAAWLETPRMFHPGYRAVVNGQDIAPVKSREGLVAVPVPAGRSEVTLSYHPPFLLVSGYWISLTAIVACLGALLNHVWRRPPA